MTTSITEIGSSSSASGNGDLALKITKMLASLEQEFSIGGLTSVPDHLRNLDEQAFTPLLISIGPIHLSNAKLQTMRKFKERLCGRFIQRANISPQNLVHKIREKEEKIRSYYTETIVSSISSDDFVIMILVDGMFILECFLRHSEESLERDDPTIKIPGWMPPILRFDLVLLENQFPFSVLEMLYEQAPFPAELEKKSLRKLAFEFFKYYNIQGMDSENFNKKIEHFTDLVRFFYLGESELPDRISGRAKLSYSATQLHEAGITLKVAREIGGRFLDISFDLNSGVLQIPCMMLGDERIRVIRNIIALEQPLYVDYAYVTDFFVILDFLINTSKDVDLLCDKGILVNYLGDSDAAASVVNNLSTNVLWDYVRPDYKKVCEDLNVFYKKPWHKWKAMLSHQYFSTPWRAASTSAAIILLLLTLTQTICALIAT